MLDLGFTGLITNGVADYRSLYDPQKLTAGGAPGVLTVDQLSPRGTTDNLQEYGFQFGVRAGTTGPFMAHTRVVSPFAGTTPVGSQSIGLVLGTGTQDDYVKVELVANGGTPGVRALREIGGVITTSSVTPLALPGPDAVELYLEVDPATSTVQPAMQVVTGGVTGPRQTIGGPLAVPASWLDGHAGVAVGLLGSSPAGAVLSGTWDMLEAVPMGTVVAARPDATIKRAGDAAALGNNIYNLTGAGQTRTLTTGANTSRTYVVKVWNDAATADSFLIKGLGSVTGFTVRYLMGPSGTTDITAAVIAGTYRMANVAAGGGRVLRLIVTLGASVPPAAVRDWLITATSQRDATARDAVLARIMTP